MHQAILMHADIDKRTEVGDVGYRAFQNHARLEVFHVLNAFLEFGSLEFRTRIAARLFQFADDVFYRWHTETFAGVVGRVQFTQEADVADQILQRPTMLGGDAFYHHIGFRVNRRAVQRVFAAHHTQKAGGLFKCFVTQPRHLLQRITIGKDAILFPIADNIGGDGAVQAGNTRQQWCRGGIDINAHRINTVFHHAIQAACQFDLADIVLVLANANGFRINFYQLGKRVLQTTGNRYSTTVGHIKIRELPCR